jgi:hypothetical protein
MDFIINCKVKAGNEYFRNKNILLISPEPWSHLFVSKHHYAIELGKGGNNVFFLNPPSKSFSIEKTAYENLSIINYSPFVKGLRFFPSFIQHYFMKRKLSKLQSLASVKFNCIWSFDNSVFFDFSFLPKQVLKICHIVDYSQNFQFRKAASTADICFGVSQNIVDRLKQENANSFLIPHGVSLTRKEGKEFVPPGRNPIKAMYAGNLDSHLIDKELLFSLIDDNPEVDFIFLGSGGKNWIQKPNTFYLGKVNNDELDGYLEKADVLLLIYNSEKFPDQLTNAHKILEYLRAGVTTVSTFMTDYEGSTLLEMVLNKNELPIFFKRVIDNLPHYNDQNRRDERKQFALKNSYGERIRLIENYTNKVIENE